MRCGHTKSKRKKQANWTLAYASSTLSNGHAHLVNMVAITSVSGAVRSPFSLPSIFETCRIAQDAGSEPETEDTDDVNRMLATDHLPLRVRLKLLEYIAQKMSGAYDDQNNRLKAFAN